MLCVQGQTVCRITCNVGGSRSTAYQTWLSVTDKETVTMAGTNRKKSVAVSNQAISTYWHEEDDGLQSQRKPKVASLMNNYI